MSSNSDRISRTILLIGLSGPSSSGKTTLARLLRQVINNIAIHLFILHQDDFYKSDADIPRKTFWSAEHGARELDDWDCSDSVDLPLFRRTLEHIRTHGRVPDDMFSKEDQNSVGPDVVDADIIESFKSQFLRWLDLNAGLSKHQEISICLLDGFLLYPPAYRIDGSTAELYQITKLLTHRLFVPCTRFDTISRRSRRTGYVTLEGFWADPPGYVEDVVWPNYAKYHAWLFRNDRYTDNLEEGNVDLEIARSEKIEVAPRKQMQEIVAWGIARIQDALAESLSSLNIETG